MALVLSSALWRSAFYYLLLYDVDKNVFCRLDDDFDDVNEIFILAARRSIFAKSMADCREAAA